MPIIKAIDLPNEVTSFYKQFIKEMNIKNPRTGRQASIKYVIEMVAIDFAEQELLDRAREKNSGEPNE